jgi:hypothetical protein
VDIFSIFLLAVNTSLLAIPTRMLSGVGIISRGLWIISLSLFTSELLLVLVSSHLNMLLIPSLELLVILV